MFYTFSRYGKGWKATKKWELACRLGGASNYPVSGGHLTSEFPFIEVDRFGWSNVAISRMDDTTSPRKQMRSIVRCWGFSKSSTE